MAAENISNNLGFSTGFHPPDVMKAIHQHQEIEINFSPSGGLTYLTANGIIEVPKNRLAVFWAASPHQVIAVESKKPFYWFNIPFAWVLHWKLPESFMEALLHGRFFIGEENDPIDEPSCVRWRRDILSGENNNLHAAQLEIEARLRRLISNLSTLTVSNDSPYVSKSPVAVQKMTEVIVRGYTRPLTIAEIVQPTGLHPNYAMTLFRSTCGASILDYLIQHRLFHAARLLATTDMKIIEVAFESGFGSQSRFYEAFTLVNKCSPSTFRRQMQAADPGRKK
ncbi:MAG: helix-turn-helix domain-containing protein [Chthoniobacterales bacterium]